MNRKLNSIKPYIKFYLERQYGKPIKDSYINAICNKGKIVTTTHLGEGYVLLNETTLVTESEIFGGEE